jgi:hypothetical protein
VASGRGVGTVVILVVYVGHAQEVSVVTEPVARQLEGMGIVIQGFLLPL